MKRLYVGCRVRVVSVRQPTEVRVGWQGVVNEIGCEDGDGNSGCVGVTFDGDPSWAFLPSELEPIQDPGHEVISWEEMRGLWQPQGVGA